MARRSLSDISRRERQIMDVVYRRGRVTVQQVQDEMPDPPSYSAVRAMLRILEEKGHLRHVADGPRYVYLPMRSKRRAARSAIRGLVETFFDGSPGKAVAALLDASETDLSQEEIREIEGLIDKARKDGR